MCLMMTPRAENHHPKVLQANKFGQNSKSSRPRKKILMNMSKYDAPVEQHQKPCSIQWINRV